MKKTTTLLIFVLLMGVLTAYATDGDTTAIQRDKKPKKEKSEVRTGWTFGILPSVAYDADKGFQ